MLSLLGLLVVVVDVDGDDDSGSRIPPLTNCFLERERREREQERGVLSEFKDVWELSYERGLSSDLEGGFCCCFCVFLVSTDRTVVIKRPFGSAGLFLDR